MGRYEILLNIPPNENNAQALQTFGFDNCPMKDKTIKEFKEFKKYKYFIPTDKITRVGIVYNDPTKIFKKTYVHYNKYYFLCKSGNDADDAKEICCKLSNSSRTVRIGCVIVVYKGTLKYELLAWTFGIKTFSLLSSLHSTFNLLKNDLLIKKSKVPFLLEIISGSESLWKDACLNPQISTSAIDEIYENLESYMGRNLSNEQIQELYHV